MPWLCRERGPTRRTRDADRALHGDLPDPLVHRDRDERGDEQEANDETDAAEDEGQLAKIREALVDPSKRLTTVQDVAQCIVALSMPATRWMTGNVIRIDGGEKIAG